MTFVIDKTVEINAPAELVWEVLTDVKRYGEWNPFVEQCETTLEPGGPINMKVRLGSKLQTANEILVDVQPGKRFSYRMKPVPPGALSSFRSHDIEFLDGNRSRYRSYFELKGWMMPLVRGLMGRHLQTGFAGMTEGVKRRSEQLWSQRQSKTPPP